VSAGGTSPWRGIMPTSENSVRTTLSLAFAGEVALWSAAATTPLWLSANWASTTIGRRAALAGLPPAASGRRVPSPRPGRQRRTREPGEEALSWPAAMVRGAVCPAWSRLSAMPTPPKSRESGRRLEAGSLLALSSIPRPQTEGSLPKESREGHVQLPLRPVRTLPIVPDCLDLAEAHDIDLQAVPS